MDKMQDWEVYDIYEMLNQCNADSWEQTRLLMYIITASNSHKRINKSIQEWFPLPWDPDYKQHSKAQLKKTISNEEKLKMILHHLDLLKDLKNSKVALLEMRSHAAWYLKGIPNTSELKKEIFKITKIDELNELINKFIKENNYE